MIEEKGASPPCGKRHSSKNISNVNLSTQKKTGGKCIMGNQGMTNWKFSAFLAIALMLVAGLFTSTAMAAANDGHGTIIVTASDDEGGETVTFYQAGDDSADPPVRAILFAAEAGYELEFTYTATKNMDGGAIVITKPPSSDWKIPAADVRASDTGNTPESRLFPVDSTADGADADNDLIEITKDGDGNVIEVKIPLAGDRWKNATADIPAGLIITFNTVTSATPSSLHVPTEGNPYREYRFRTKTMASGGSPTPLAIGESGANPQPPVRVGSVVNGKGTVTVNPPAVYERERDRNFQITFEAAGPMYDVDSDDDGELRH